MDKDTGAPIFEYQGLNDYEAKYLQYLLQNCFDLCDAKIKSLVMVCNGDSFSAQIVACDRGMICVTSNGTYDDVKASLTIKSFIQKENEEAYNAIDTFYFTENEIVVKSNVPYYCAPFIRNIPHFVLEEHRQH